MALWPDLLRTKRSRFKDRVERELEFYVAAYGDGARERILIELERPELRSRYRDVLKAAADLLATRAAAAPKPAGGGGLAATLRRAKPGKTRSRVA